MNNTQQAIQAYYDSFESRWGYALLLGDAKHFGYYPDKIANIPEREALRLQQELIAQSLVLRPGDLVLDAGCGRGVTGCYVAEHYNVGVIGVDLLDFEIRKSCARASKKRIGHLPRFLQMDFSKMSFPESHFDAAYTSETLSHAPDVLGVLREMNRVLKPGGRIVLMEYSLAEDKAFSKQEADSLEFIIGGSAMVGLRQFRHERLRELLESSGFENVSIRNISRNIRPSLSRLASIARWVEPLLRIPGIERYLFNAAVPKRLLPLLDADLFRYNMITAQKLGPSSPPIL